MQKSPSKYDKRMYLLLKLYALVVGVGGLVIGLFGEQKLVKQFRPFALVGALTVLLFIFFLFILSIQSLGYEKGKTTFGSQFVFVFSRMTKWIFLPAIVLTLIMVTLMWQLGTL